MVEQRPWQLLNLAKEPCFVSQIIVVRGELTQPANAQLLPQLQVLPMWGLELQCQEVIDSSQTCVCFKEISRTCSLYCWSVALSVLSHTTCLSVFRIESNYVVQASLKLTSIGIIDMHSHI